MKESVNKSMFHQRFADYNRKDQFSSAGLSALFDYLEEYEESCGTEIELDVIALCCDYSEISIKDIEQETGCKSLEELQDNTTVITVDDETVIYASF